MAFVRALRQWLIVIHVADATRARLAYLGDNPSRACVPTGQSTMPSWSVLKTRALLRALAPKFFAPPAQTAARPPGASNPQATQELDAARKKGLDARILIPLTRAHGGPALQFEVALTKLDQLEDFRHRGAGSKDKTGDWMHGFSEILLAPPAVEILRTEEPRSA